MAGTSQSRPYLSGKRPSKLRMFPLSSEADMVNLFGKLMLFRQDRKTMAPTLEAKEWLTRHRSDTMRGSHLILGELGLAVEPLLEEVPHLHLLAVCASGSRIQGSECRIEGVGCRVLGLGVWGFGGLGVWVWSLGSGVWGIFIWIARVQSSGLRPSLGLRLWRSKLRARVPRCALQPPISQINLLLWAGKIRRPSLNTS
jgi:hypothetical protein